MDFEQLIAFLSSHLPRPVEETEGSDGSYVFTGGEPAEVIVYLTHASVLVAQVAGAWEQPHGLMAEPQPVGEVQWRGLPEKDTMDALTALIRAARAVRLATYRTCERCGTPTPPELMEDDARCVDCAGRPPETIH